jgi:hypothetical protein
MHAPGRQSSVLLLSRQKICNHAGSVSTTSRSGPWKGLAIVLRYWAALGKSIPLRTSTNARWTRGVRSARATRIQIVGVCWGSGR